MPPAIPRVSALLSTSISCNVDRATLSLGDNVIVSGQISSSEGEPGGAPVTLTYVRPDSASFNRLVFTDAFGRYVDAYTPALVGSWSVYAFWSGNSNYLGATSTTASFTITEAWPMFHRDLNHTGYTSIAGSTTNNTLWSYDTGNSIYQSSPAISGGLVYIGTQYYVYCFNVTTGALKWSVYTDWCSGYSSPAVADGRVYIGGYSVRCLNATTGAQLWSYYIGSDVYSSPAVSNGRVYIASYNGYVYCLNATSGSLLWSKSTGYTIYSSSPAVASGRVYIGANSYIFCLNAYNGSIIWSYYTGYWDTSYSSPAVSNGRVYIGGGGKIYCLNASSSTSTKIWEYACDYSYSSPAVSNDRVYVSGGSRVYCLSASSGSKIWDYLTGSTIYSSPAIAGNYIYVGSHDWKVYCLDASSGSKVWSYTTGGYVYSSPAVANGRVYVGSYDRRIYCFGTMGEVLNFLTKDASGNVLPSCNVNVAGVGSAISDANGWVSFSGVASGTYLVTTKWQGNTVDQTRFSAPMLRISMNISCRVYSTSFLNSFKDSNNKLLSRVTSFKLVCPNGTTTTTPMGTHRLQNGTYTVKDIYVFDKNVTPTSLPSFNPASGPPTVTCNIAQIFIGGYILTNTTWTRANSPYIVTSNIVISSGYRLTLQPGAIVCFNGSYSIIVDGALVVQGNTTNPVRLTSNRGTPSAGDWEKVHFRDSSSDRECSMEYAIVEYSNNGIYAENAAPSRVFNCTVQRNRYYSLYVSGWTYQTMNISRNTFRWNTQSSYVVYMYGCQYGSFSNNLVTNNTCSYVVYLSNYYGSFTNNNITSNTVSSYAVYLYIYYSTFSNNNITKNTGNALYISGCGSATITHNIIEYNTGYGVYGYGSTTFKYNSIRHNSIGVYSSQFPFHYCNVYGNTQYEAKVSGSQSVDASNNWWGTTSTTLISQRVYDYYDDYNLGTLSYTPVLTSPVILASEQARLTINIRSTDHLGNALTPCTVNIATIGSRTTDANGWANFTGLLSGNYTVTVSWRGAIVEGTFISVLFSNVTKDVRCWILTETEWPMFHRFQNHTGYTPSPGPSTNNTLWTYSMSSYSSPVISSGYIYVGDNNGKVYSFNAYTGEKVWEYNTGSYIYSAPAVAFGRVYVTAYNGKVYCLNASTGVRLWTYDTSLGSSSYIYSSPTISYGRIYVGTSNGLFCLNASTGTLKWRSSIWTSYSSPAVVGGQVYIGSSSYVYS